MENKQTAVDWLANQIAEIPHTYLTGKYGFIELSNVIDDKVYRINMDIIHLINEAKEIEKRQIKDAYKAGCVDEMWELNNTENEEHYYNKTYANDTTTGLPEENSKRRGWHY
jgi:hypothetical protein